MTYVEQLESRINETRKELELLYEQSSKMKINSNLNYQKSILAVGLNEKLENTSEKLRDLLNLYDYYTLVNNYINDLNNLVELYQKEENPNLRDDISKEINNKRNFISNTLNNNLPETLKKELKVAFTKEPIINEEKITNNNSEEKRKVEANLNKVENEIQNYNNELKAIFEEERNIKENTIFNSNKELDDFINLYMNKKIEQTKRIKESLKKAELLNQRLLRLNNKIFEDNRLKEEANILKITPKEYKKILTRKNDKKELDTFLKRLGLEEIIIKRNMLIDKLDKDNAKKIIDIKINKEAKDYSNIIDIKESKKALPNNKQIRKLESSDIKNVINNYMKNIELKEKETNNEIAAYGYQTVISKLVNGLEPKKKDGKRYRAANIEVKESFKKELQSGNYLYNIVHVVPAVIKLPFNFLRKVTSKITYNPETKRRMEIIKNRLDHLSDQDLMILFKDYSNHVEVERYSSGLNILIEERISRFIDEKVRIINNNLEIKYKDVYNSIKELEAIDNLLRDQSLSKYLRRDYLDYRETILDGKASLIASIRNDYNEAKTLLSSGLHGFRENIKATETKMSYVGKRFAKDHDLDVELLEREAKLERAEKRAIKDGNDEMALRVFVQAESLLSKNTSIEKSIFGNRSTGKKYYSPLAEKLDYRNDPFIRDIFTTIAMIGATTSVVNSLNAKKEIIEKQKEIDAINSHNENTINSVNNYGNMVESRKDALIEGMTKQNYQDSLNISNMLERKSLDQSSEIHGGWSVGTTAYKDFRTTAQNSYNEFYNSTKSTLEDITTNYAAGNITSLEALNKLSELSASSQSTVAKVAEESLPHLINYANNHSQFDLVGVKEAMDYIVANPTAITKMNNSVYEMTELGEELANLSIEQVTALQTIPNTIKENLISSATAASLAINVSNTMHTNYKKGKYGNNITQLVKNYIDTQDNKNKKR